MKIELEMKINEEEENNDVASQSLMNSLKDKDKHEVLFSPESSQLYSAVRPEANFEYDYEINQIRFGEEKEEEFMYIKTSSKVVGDKYIKIDPENGLFDTLNYPYAGDDKTFINFYEEENTVLVIENLNYKKRENIDISSDDEVEPVKSIEKPVFAFYIKYYLRTIQLNFDE